MSRRRKIVIGTYKCGCSFGPIWYRERLEYCGIHGEDIQNEYEVTPYVKQEEIEKQENVLPREYTVKILECEEVIEINFYIRTDEKDWNYYRRSEDGNWEVQMGESWEPVYTKEQELEKEFQRFVK